jgi:hypothetical protein
MAYCPIPPAATGSGGGSFFRLAPCNFRSGSIREPPGEFENLLPKLRRNPRPNLYELLQISVI